MVGSLPFFVRVLDGVSSIFYRGRSGVTAISKGVPFLEGASKLEVRIRSKQGPFVRY